MKNLLLMSATVILVVAAFFSTSFAGRELVVPTEYLTIQEAIDAAYNTDVITVLAGLYTGYGNTNIDFKGKAVTVRSNSGAASTTIECAGSSRGFIFSSGEGNGSVLDGFSIINGYMYNGGAIYIESSSPVIRNCEISSSQATYGGAIYCSDGSPQISYCTMENNSGGTFGGAIYFSDNSSGIVTGCTFENNTSTNGGAISFLSSSPSVSNCTFSGNSVSWNGGALSCMNASPLISNCTIDGNVTDYYGAGIYCQGSSPVITYCDIMNNHSDDEGGGLYAKDNSDPFISNCNISGNHAWIGGGGISLFLASGTVTSCNITGNDVYGHTSSSGGAFRCNQSDITITNCMITGNVGNNVHSTGGAIRIETNSHATITHCTIAGNIVPYVGGGIYSYYYSQPQITDCIIWGNTPDNLGSGVSSDPVITYSDVEDGWTGVGNIDDDPEFVGSGDYHLLGISPCIDAGSDEGINNDIDGDDRPLGNYFDMGADEYVPGTDHLTVTLSGYPSKISAGYSFKFTATVYNGDAYENAFNFAEMKITGPAEKTVTLFNGDLYYLDSDASVSKTIVQHVPENAQPGIYNVEISIYLDGTIIDSDNFNIQVTND